MKQTLTIVLIVSLMFLSSKVISTGLPYSYPLYPYQKDLSQTLTFKIMLRCALPTDVSNLDMSLVANYLRQIDCITRGMPKIVILGGYQSGGHDHTYPWWTPVDSSFTAPGRLKGKAALLWLMNEAKKYHTTCTVHVNPFDAYMDSWKWNTYVNDDLLCKNVNDSLVKGGVWWGRQSYMVNMVNEWNAGVTQQRVDDLLNDLPLIQEAGVLYFDNLTQYPSSPKHGVTQADQISAIKRTAQYLKENYNIQLIGEYADPNLYGYDALGVTWDWNASLTVNQMEVPAYIACGGRNLCHDDLLGNTNDISKRRLQVFGSSIQLEDIQFQNDPSKVVREFTHHTLVYFYLNRLLRKTLTTSGQYGMTLTFSDSVASKWESDNVHRLYRDGKLMKENYDVFMPVYWVNHKEIMAFSYQGRTGIWNFPREWKDVTAVDIYKFNSSFYGLDLAKSNVPISNNQINLDLEAGIAQIIVPAGTNINDGTLYDNPASGTVTFIDQDNTTQGDWKGIYGSSGYDIFGASSSIPENIMINYIGDSLNIINANSTRPQALQKPGDESGRIEAVRTSSLHQIIELQVPDEKVISLYFADYQNKNCQIVVDVIDVNTKRILHSKLINAFDKGTYLKYKLNGHVQFRITRFFYDKYFNPDYPVCSGIFIDENQLTSVPENSLEKDRLTCTPTFFFENLDIDAKVHNTPCTIIQIYSIAGSILYSKEAKVTNNEVRLQVSKSGLGISSGMYVVAIKTKDKILREKVVCK